jgi:Pyridoxamine 5'-phosphate oxidase
MTMHADNAQPTTPLPQGDLRLLDTAAARQLLASTVPARIGYLAADGTPRVVPTWFHWTGEALVMATFVSAPHVTQRAARIRDLQANPHVAVSIDTDGFPPVALNLRGTVSVDEHRGVVTEYAEAARRYLGQQAAEDYLAFLDHPATVMARIALRPAWVGLIDFQTRNPRTLGGIGG